ncbi:hypothetical protein HOO68_02750 [Candidatus Gracilibacteria bacterium]|nr:hypothetical protein [Candidatus Gracilibacteria bacterium]
MGNNLTPAEKLNEVYILLLAEESRRISRLRLRVFKWIIIILLVVIVVTNPEFIVGKITEIMKPIILSTASGMIENQKSELINSLKNILPGGAEIQ